MLLSIYCTGNTYILESPVHIVRCCGVIHYWEFYPVDLGWLYFIVWRKSGEDFENKREIVGFNTFNVDNSKFIINKNHGNKEMWYDSLLSNYYPTSFQAAFLRN